MPAFPIVSKIQYGGPKSKNWLALNWYAAGQVKKAMPLTHELGGDGYVFWGGHGGYSNQLEIDMRREFDHSAEFLHLAVDYKKQIGFQGQFYIEPKPKEPTKHQYHSDAAACLNSSREDG